MQSRVRAMLAWVVMAALCGAIGFAIVYYYSTNARPVERFAIVIDAGSTQTRSNLFKISISADDLAERLAGPARAGAASERPPALGELIRVQQVSSCVNGGPMAALEGPRAARELVKRCLGKFSEHIKLLDFVDVKSKLALDEPDDESALAGGAGESTLDADEVSQQMALINHRVNSITHLHLGATAGMRALAELSSTRARERLAWMETAIGESNSMLADNSPYINRGYVGILAGSDEASFGWLSVNFVCDALNASVDAAAGAGAGAGAGAQPAPQSVNQGTAHRQSSGVMYETLTDRETDTTGAGSREPAAHDREPLSVGTLELGGASAQMAFQVPNNLAGSERAANMSLDERQLDLFNDHYKLATRSDLCLGMSQAVLRLNYILLHKTMNASRGGASNGGGGGGNFQSSSLKLSNACLQRGASVKLTGDELANLWLGACLAPNERLHPALVERDRIFRLLMIGKESIEFLGSGNVDQCNQLLGELIEPAACARYFSLCPAAKNRLAPPRGMPFVTISGYNHALNVLDLSPDPAAVAAELGPDDSHPTTAGADKWAPLGATIDDKLGGSPVSYSELLAKTRDFCATRITEIPARYPKTSKLYENIICLQLVYIRKLLTEFYLFDPLTSWAQIRFLVFTPKSVPEQYTRIEPVTGKLGHTSGELRPDIGWTLGLLLNATSQQLADPQGATEVYFHHGATVMYIVRTVILLMLACFLIAIALLVVGIVEVRLAQERGDAYAGHGSASSSYSSRSSYDVRRLSEQVGNARSTTGAVAITAPAYLIEVQQYQR